MYFQNGGEFAIVPPVEGTQPVEIFEPVLLLPKELYVPWDPVRRSIHYQMTVSGTLVVVSILLVDCIICERCYFNMRSKADISHVSLLHTHTHTHV